MIGIRTKHRIINSGRRTFLLPLLLSIFLTLPGALSAQAVRSVRVEGCVRIGAASVERTFAAQSGDLITPELIREGIENLYATRQYESIRVDREETPSDGQTDLVIIVVERPLLGEFTVTGSDRIKENELLEETLLRTGLVRSERTLFREKKRMLDYYREKGYRNADIGWEIVSIDSIARENVLYTIDEGKKVKVKRVVVKGADRVDEGKLRKEMKTKADSWLRSGDFKEEEFEEDQDKIRRYYWKNGYLDARVESTSVTLGENGSDLTVTVYVTEGDQYYTGTITFDGNEQFPTSILERSNRLEEGKVFDQEQYEETIGNLYSIYSEDGYIFTNIVPERKPDEQIVHIVFHINEGNPAVIERVNISGNKRTKERTIRRELAIAPGDLFRRSRIIRSQRELQQLGFFNDIRFDYQPVRGTDKINISFEVDERQTGEASMGAGFSSLNGATGFLRLSKVNLFGGGERANLMWEFGNFQQVEVSYTEPWLFDTPTVAGIDFALIRRNWDSYTEYRKGGGVRLGRRLPWLDYSRADTQFRLEERKIEADDDASQAVKDAAGTNTLSSTRLSFTRNSTDRLFHPTSGTVATVSGEWAGGIIGGSTEYQQYEIENRWYFPSFWKFFLGLRSRIGVVDGLSSPATVPVYKRYRLGGTGVWGLRGYDDRRVVPEGNPFDFGGRAMLILSAEYKFPIAANTIFGLFFFDAGNTWNSFQDIRPNDLKRSAGMGVRFMIPMLGQMGFDFGYGLDREEGASWEPHFQLGSMF